MKPLNCDAVSPVVGVMLMLVVTIIIAAVVSAFAGGFGGNQEKTPQVSLTAEPVIAGFSDTDDTNGAADYATGFTAANGIKFENKGGDTFMLSGIDVILEGGGTTYTITPSDKMNDPTVTGSGEWGADLPTWTDYNGVHYYGFSDGGYFLKIGGASKTDKTISPGDKFMLYADGHYDATNAGWGATSGKYLVWRPAGTENGIGVQFGTKLGWTVVDKSTSKPIASGYVVFR